MDRTEAEKFLAQFESAPVLGTNTRLPETNMPGVPGVPGAPEGITLSAPPTVPDQFDPAVAAMAARTAPIPPESQRQAQFINETHRITGGVPFDPNEEIGAWQRIALSFRGAKEDKIRYLQNKYGEDGVKLDSEGDIIVRITDEKGNPKYIPVDEKRMTAKDVLDVTAAVPEMLGAMFGMRAGRSVPVIGKLKGVTGILREATAGAVGANIVGAGEDIAAQTIDTGRPDFPAIGKSRAIKTGVETVAGTGMALFGKGLGRVITPFSSKQEPVQFDAERARDYFKNTYGIDIPTTPGEVTGNPFLQRVESMLKKLPGSSGEYDKIRAAQEKAFREVQNIAIGLRREATSADVAALPSARSVGAEAISELENRVGGAEVSAATSRAVAIDQANKELLRRIDAAAPGTRQLFKSKVGEAIRARAVTMRDEFEAEANRLYTAAKVLPGGRDKLLSPPNLASDAKQLRKALPSKDVVKVVPSGILGPSGKPLYVSVSSQEPLKPFIPDKVLAKLDTLADLPHQKFSLEELIQMRNEVTNDIKVGESIPGVQTHYLSKIRDVLTKAINESTDALPTSDLKTAWQTANQYYADNVGKFHRQGVVGILKDPDAPGYVGDSEIVQRLTSGGAKANDLFRDMREFLGPTSPEFTSLKRSIADDIVSKATTTGGEIVDANSFLQGLKRLYDDNAEIARAVFGAKGQWLADAAHLLKIAQGAKLDPSAVVKAMAAGSPQSVERAFRKAVHDQANFDRLYRNKILKAIAEKDVEKIGIEPEEFVSRFYENASQRELEEVISQLSDNPELLGRIRQKVIQKIFYQAARKPAANDPILLADDITKLPNTQSLMKALAENAQAQEKAQTILGNETFNLMVQFAKAMKPSEAIESTFASAGGISAGM